MNSRAVDSAAGERSSLQLPERPIVEVTLRIDRPQRRTQWRALGSLGLAASFATVSLLEASLQYRAANPSRSQLIELPRLALSGKDLNGGAPPMPASDMEDMDDTEINIHYPGSPSCALAEPRARVRECLRRFAPATEEGSLALEFVGAKYLVSDYQGLALSHATILLTSCWQAEVAKQLGPTTARWPKLVQITWKGKAKE